MNILEKSKTKLQKIQDTLKKYEIIINILLFFILCVSVILILFKDYDQQRVNSSIQDYINRTINPSLVSIDEHFIEIEKQHEVFIKAHNEHVRYCEAGITCIKNNSDRILKIEQDKLGSVISKDKSCIKVEVKAVPVAPIVPIVPKKTVPPPIIKEEKVVIPDAEQTLFPAIDDKTSEKKVREALRVLLNKHDVVDAEDLDNIMNPENAPTMRRVLWQQDYEKFLLDLENGKFKKGFFEK